MLPKLSPGGRPTCPSVGPLQSRVLFVAESPSDEELVEQEPLVGPAGRIFNLALGMAGFLRPEVRLSNTVPAQPPGNKFANHSAVDLAWGKALLQAEIRAMPNLELIVCLGAEPTKVVMDVAPISAWRGSLLPAAADLRGDVYNEYWTRLHRQPEVELGPRTATLSTYHPSLLNYQFSFQVWLISDLKRARRYLEGDLRPRYRRWFINQPSELPRIAERILRERLSVAVDTEMEPPICSWVTEEEVHSWYWDDRYRETVRQVMESDQVLKVAHNMAHDWKQHDLWWGIQVRPPYVDTIGAAHVLEPSGFSAGDEKEETGEQYVGKKLSPHISSMWTPWPHHKWLELHDQLAYCGMDSVVAYDAWEGQKPDLDRAPGPKACLEMDLSVWPILYDMGKRGVLVDMEARQTAEEQLSRVLADLDARLTDMALARVKERLPLLQKPHLFQEIRVCTCCRSSAKKSQACWSCAGFEEAPSRKQLAERWEAWRQNDVDSEAGTHKAPASDYSKAELEALILGPCQACETPGQKATKWAINWNAPDQVGDVLYRAFGIPPRTYEGSETTRFDQIERLLEPGALLGKPDSNQRQVALVRTYVSRAKAQAEWETVARLRPGPDGRLHSVFDPWYTPTGRIASREGLFEVGTNLQNIPEEARRFIVADPGYVFLYPDSAQIEGRAVAVLSGDPAMTAIYRSGQDSHMLVSDRIFEVCGIRLSRQQSKRLTYACLYGIEAPHLADILGVPLTMAMKVLSAFWQIFPGVRDWFSRKVPQELRATRSNTSPTGWRRRWLSHVVYSSGKRKGQLIDKLVKEALSTGPQNIGRHVLDHGMKRVAERLPWLPMAAHVHDALLILCPRERVAEAIPLVDDAMSVTLWGMPFPAKASVGPNWYIASLKEDDKPLEWQRETLLKAA